MAKDSEYWGWGCRPCRLRMHTEQESICPGCGAITERLFYPCGGCPNGGVCATMDSCAREHPEDYR